MAGTSASCLQVVFDIVGLHVECDEPILNQVHDCVEWFLTYIAEGEKQREIESFQGHTGWLYYYSSIEHSSHQHNDTSLEFHSTVCSASLDHRT